MQANTELIPPYSLYLADYVSPASNRLAANLLLTDLSQGSRRVKLRLVIEGLGITIQTRADFLPPPITLQAGVNERLVGVDLADYFNPNNLIFQGFSRAEYEKTKKLPEGIYRIGFQVLDYDRNVLLSNPQVGTATAWLLLNDPPFLNLPMAAEQVKPLEPQNVIFQWTPRHTASPNAAFNVIYEFTLVWIQPKGANPNAVMLSNQPIYETTTNATTLVYGIAEPNLIPGEQYAWRVRAINQDGLDLFKNSGYSEVAYFTYGSKCLPPLNLQAEAPNAQQLRLSWEASAGNTLYQIRYKVEEDPEAEWFTEQSTVPYVNLYDLQPATLYRYEIRSECEAVNSEETLSDTLRTPALLPNDFACGAPTPPIDLSNRTLMASLNQWQVIQAMDFDVTLTEVRGNNGIFSGEGFIVVGMLNNAKLQVAFEDILVNEEGRMLEGQMAVVSGSVQALDDATIAEVEAVLTELEGALDDLEAGVAQLDAALAKLDNLMEQFMRYLPEDKAIRLTSARADLQEKKEAWQEAKDDPTLSQEEKDQVKEDLKDARDEVVSAYGEAAAYYGEALVRFVDIIWESLKELKKEYIDTEEETQQALDEAGILAIETIYDQQGIDRPTETPSEVQLMESFQLTQVSPTPSPRKTQVEERLSNFREQRKKERIATFMLSMFVYYLSQEEV
ncbi:MAG: fibronectin type III domain-containing protein, partial [Bacteroidota bacterium]